MAGTSPVILQKTGQAFVEYFHLVAWPQWPGRLSPNPDKNQIDAISSHASGRCQLRSVFSERFLVTFRLVIHAIVTLPSLCEVLTFPRTGRAVNFSEHRETTTKCSTTTGTSMMVRRNLRGTCPIDVDSTVIDMNWTFRIPVSFLLFGPRCLLSSRLVAQCRWSTY